MKRLILFTSTLLLATSCDHQNTSGWWAVLCTQRAQILFHATVYLPEIETPGDLTDALVISNFVGNARIECAGHPVQSLD